MSIAAGKLPIDRFRRERLRRGWSREYVAEQIGIADAKTIGRWERGVAFPRAFYLQKLCALFGMFAEDLGFFHVEETQEPLEKCSEQFTVGAESLFPLYASLPLYDPAIPALPAETGWMLGMSELLSQMKQGLCVDGQPISSALYGRAGVGKTSLAIDLAHDHDIQQHFCDGILWAELGSRPDIPEMLRRWGILLGLTPLETEGLRGVAELAGILHAAMAARRMLLVIDDARRSEDALAFKQGGLHCAYVLTTRIASVALDFACDRTMLMRELDSQGDKNSGMSFSPFLPSTREIDENGESGASPARALSNDGFSLSYRLS